MKLPYLSTHFQGVREFFNGQFLCTCTHLTNVLYPTWIISYKVEQCYLEYNSIWIQVCNVGIHLLNYKLSSIISIFKYAIQILIHSRCIYTIWSYEYLKQLNRPVHPDKSITLHHFIHILHIPIDKIVLMAFPNACLRQQQLMHAGCKVHEKVKLLLKISKVKQIKFFKGTFLTLSDTNDRMGDYFH